MMMDCTSHLETLYDGPQCLHQGRLKLAALPIQGLQAGRRSRLRPTNHHRAYQALPSDLQFAFDEEALGALSPTC